MAIPLCNYAIHFTHSGFLPYLSASFLVGNTDFENSDASWLSDSYAHWMCCKRNGTSSFMSFVLSNSLVAQANCSQSWTNTLDGFKSSRTFASWGKCYQERKFYGKFQLLKQWDFMQVHPAADPTFLFSRKRVSKRPIGTNFVLLAATSEFICLQNTLFVILLSLREHNSAILIRGIEITLIVPVTHSYWIYVHQQIKENNLIILAQSRQRRIC